MKRELPKFCYAKPKGIYFQRRGWLTVRFTSTPGTPDFAREYALILQGTPPLNAGTRTFLNLIRLYQNSEKWEKLAPRTKSDYQTVLTYIEAKMGTLPPERMQRKDVIRARDSNAQTIRFANYVVQVLRILFEHAIDLGWREENPAKKVSTLASTGPGRVPWPADMITAYRAAAPLGTRQRLIFEMLLGTGQRIGDVLKARWDDIEGGGINVRQGKTGARLWLPFTRDLKAALDATKKTGLTICAGPSGIPAIYRVGADLMLAVRKKIGAEAYDAHALRYTAAAELAALGCTDEVIMSVTGHKTSAMVAKYAGPARQKARATEAMNKRDAVK